MSLATRCPACGTVFRVVQDQLRVSEGWVRCGRCEDVFNALEGLFDLERDAPPAWSASGSPVPTDVAPELDVAQAAPRPASEAAATPDLGPESDVGASPPEIRPPGETGRDFDEQSTLILDSVLPPAAPESELPAESAAPVLVDVPAVGFLRQAERAARWRQPRVRAALALAALLLGGLLAVQAALQWHDEMAARWPASRPLVGTLCELAGCNVDAPRRMDSLTVESSGLVKADDANVYRLSLVLRNRDAVEVRLPAVELTLTDAQGRVVARRVLRAGELGARQTSLAGGAELALLGLMAGGEFQFAGYSIELFYP
jgi:predicted Zn finger-like uncharacterized protein